MSINKAQQALRILKILEQWSSTGRGFRIEKMADGRFSATLLSVDRRTVTGGDIVDCLAQLAQVVDFEPEEPEYDSYVEKRAKYL